MSQMRMRPAQNWYGSRLLDVKKWRAALSDSVEAD